MAPSPPAWIVALVEVVAECLDVHRPMGSVGFRFLEKAPGLQLDTSTSQ